MARRDRRDNEDDEDNGSPGGTYDPPPAAPAGFDPVVFGRMQSDLSNQKRNIKGTTNRLIALEETVDDLAKEVNDGHTEVIGKIGELTTLYQINQTKQGATWKTITIIAAVVVGLVGLIGTMLSIAGSVQAMRADIRKAPPPVVGPVNPGQPTP